MIEQNSRERWEEIEADGIIVEIEKFNLKLASLIEVKLKPNVQKSNELKDFQLKPSQATLCLLTMSKSYLLLGGLFKPEHIARVQSCDINFALESLFQGI